MTNKFITKHLTRQVLIEKAPFEVCFDYADYDYGCGIDIYLVRKAVSIKEVIDGLTRGFSWEDKKSWAEQKLQILNPKDFYIVIKGPVRKDEGKVLRISHTKKVSKIQPKQPSL